MLGGSAFPVRTVTLRLSMRPTTHRGDCASGARLAPALRGEFLAVPLVVDELALGWLDIIAAQEVGDVIWTFEF